MARAHRLLFVGRRAADPLLEVLDGYVGRLGRLAATELLRIRPAGPAAEARAMLALRRPREALVVCDGGGEPLASERLAALVAALGRQHTGIAWAVGGADGLDPALAGQATHSWSLGPLTLPHRLAQVIVAEQLYRAETILARGGYHHGSRPAGGKADATPLRSGR